MTDPVILIFLNVALAGFTGLLAWFLKELWGLWKETRDEIVQVRLLIEDHRRHDVEAISLMREIIAELRLELAKDYVPSTDFKDLKERVGTIEHRDQYAGKHHEP